MPRALKFNLREAPPGLTGASPRTRPNMGWGECNEPQHRTAPSPPVWVRGAHPNLFPRAPGDSGLPARTAGRVARWSVQVVPDSTTTTVLVQYSPLDQSTEMLLERVAVRAGQLDRVADGHAAVLAGELDDLE